MAFPTISWKHLQPSCMGGVQYHVTSPQEYTSLSTNNNTLDVQCYTSPQDSLSTNNNTLDAQCYTSLSTNNIPLDYISNRLAQDYEALHDTMPIEGYSALADLIALGAQNQLLNSTNLERSNIDWLNQASSYEYKDAQLEPLINSSSTISSTSLSPPPHNIIDHYSFGNGNQALATYINNDSPPLIVNNLLHNKPLGFEAKSLDLHPIEQELAIYHNVGACTQFINEENLMPPTSIKSLAQGDQMNTISLHPPSLVKQKAMKFNPPSSICRSHLSHSCVRLGTAEDLLSNEERGNAVVKREERENEDHVLSCNMFGYSTMMLNSNTPIQFGGVRRETEKKSCREEGALSLCREERETSGSTGKRENKYIIGDERETRRGKKYIGDEKEEGGERYNGSLVEVKRENVSRKRGRENYVCKRRARGGGEEEEEGEEEEVILVRARRGQATDSHSLAERVRRERISQRMKLLQDLVPSCTKVLGKAAVLEEIINYVKSLQQQIEFLSMRLATTDYQKRCQI